MKFTLVIWICTFLNQTCSPPIKTNYFYDSWNECVVAAYNNSITFLTQQNIEDVNNMRLATKFVCKEVDSV